jgi:hypothetical protein
LFLVILLIRLFPKFIKCSKIEELEKNLKEEKLQLDLKVTNLEANLKSKTKQLHQRIEQVHLDFLNFQNHI